ncbi:MAG TPA: pyridoxal phosphate-dependent aminotransferase [Gammaproteobacteria bacterium]|nr:pyridoxal phosphate-dependent aminotransferase [Gammaproteobacteria bacterium]
MNFTLSQRAKNLKPSPTLAVTARAAALKAAGKDIIGLGAGEPDFDTPDFIKTAGILAIEQGATKYTAVDGTVELKQAIINKLKRDNQLTYTQEQILASCGGKHSFYNLTQALLDTGDEVIVPAPYWVSYPPMVELTGASAKIIDTDASQLFKITPAQLKHAISNKTRMLILNSPSNPTGAVYSDAELRALADVLKNHPNILIVSDDIYEAIVWNIKPYRNILSVAPELYDQTMVLNGVSKAYSMTGWRIGYAAGPANIIKAMKTIQSQSTSNPTSISQAAAACALEGEQDCIQTMLSAFIERHNRIQPLTDALPGVSCNPAQGAFYLFPDFSQAIQNTEGVSNDIEMAEYLLEKAGVALVPGSAFGAPGFMRLSFATSMENLEEALRRLKNAL